MWCSSRSRRPSASAPWPRSAEHRPPPSATVRPHRQETPVDRDVIENPVTRERGVIRRSPDDDRGTLVADLYAAPGAAVVGEHVHPHSEECFTVVRGRLGVRLDGHESEAGPGTRIVVPAGTPHD